MALRSYEDFEEAVKAARVDYDHSKAKMITKGKTVRKSRKTALLSALSTSRFLSRAPDVANTKLSKRKKPKATTKNPENRIPSKSGDPKLQIFVKTPVELTVCLQVNSSTSVLALKKLIQDQSGVAVEKHHLYTMRGFQLSDVLTLADHGLQQDANLELRMSTGLMGGRKKKSGKKRRNHPEEKSQKHDNTNTGEDEKKPPDTVPEGAAAAIASTKTSTTITCINSPIFFGKAENCTFNYDKAQVPVTGDVTNDGEVDGSWTERLFHLLKRKVKQHGKTECLELMASVFRDCDSEISQIQPGSLKFLLCVGSKEGLDKLWVMVTSGELAKRLTEILVTDELAKEEKSRLAVKVEMSRMDYKTAREFLEKLQTASVQQELPVRMGDWTKDHVSRWLREIGIADSVITQIYEENIDGKVLEIYTEHDLVEDFENMKKRDLRLLLYRRNEWIHSKIQTTMSTKETVIPHDSQSTSDEESITCRLTKQWSPEISEINQPVFGTHQPDQKPSDDGSEHGQSVEPSSTAVQADISTSLPRDDTGIRLHGVDHEDLVHGSEQSFDHSKILATSPRPTAGIDEATMKDATSKALCGSQTQGNIQTNETRLRKLLTGDEEGELDRSKYPILVANTPLQKSSCLEAEDEMNQQFGFIKVIRWTAVFDFNSKSLSDGLGRIYYDDRTVTLQTPQLFNNIDRGVAELRNSIEFPQKTLWIFANGREDNQIIKTPQMNRSEWNRERSRDVEEAVTFFSNPAVIPEGRELILFLLLSEDDIGILCDIFRKMSSSFRGLQNITCIAENEQLYAKFVNQVKCWFQSDADIDERSLIGLKWRDLNRIVLRMHGINVVGKIELPTNISGEPCFVSERQKDEWNDISVISKNECENTDMDEQSQSFAKFAKGKELNFYRGEKADWWNFAINEKDVANKRSGHVLKRTGFGELLRKVIKPLQSKRRQDSVIVTITLLHEPGAGGSTLGRHVLWELHKNHRCIVMHEITKNTVNQIMEVRKYGYKEEKADIIPPVCVLIDDFDDVEVLDLIEELEDTPKNIPCDGGAVCVLLYCRRVVDPKKLQREELSVHLTQKLYPEEKEWFQQKYDELESKENKFRTGDYNPDNLLAFMVMKEEFKKDYIENVVKRILTDDYMKDNELELIKYCALLNSYMHEAEIPIPCCDMLMAEKLKTKKTTYLQCKNTKTWEKLVSPSFKIIVVITENRTIKIFHKSIAEEALKQLRQKGDKSVSEVTMEFLNSELLRSESHSRKDLVKTTHDFLIRREKLSSRQDAKTAFSLLIEDIMKKEKNGPQKAKEILKTGIEKLKDAFIAQHLARLYLSEDNFKLAQDSVDKALELDKKKPYFWDTKGRVFFKHLKMMTAPYVANQQVIRGNEFKEVLSLSFQAMKSFHESFSLSKEGMHFEYSALYAELDVAFKLLEVIQLCVEPFRTKQDINSLRTYLLSSPTDIQPSWDKESHSQVEKLKSRLDDALEEMDNELTQYKDESSAYLVGAKLEEMREKLERYSRDYLQYYGEPMPFQQSRYDGRDPASLAECRRREVKQLECGRFADIFDLPKCKSENLEKSCELLEENVKGHYNFFDLKILICIHLALSSIGKQRMSADDVYEQFVRKLNDLDRNTRNDCWAPFMMMMFLWPIQDVASERRDRKNLSFYVEQLRERSKGGHKIKDLNLPGRDRAIRHSRYHMKSRTHFFLGKGQDMEVFVHINEIHASQSKLDQRGADAKFWNSDTVKNRLVRLEGVLLSNTSLVHRHNKDKIYIKLAFPHSKHTVSQEKVTFYLGFSWTGPVAYNVTLVGRESSMEIHEPRYHQAYPHHILPSKKRYPSATDANFDGLLKECHEIEETLKALNKKERTDKITAMIRAKERELKKKRDEVKRAWQEDN